MLPTTEPFRARKQARSSFISKSLSVCKVYRSLILVADSNATAPSEDVVYRPGPFARVNRRGDDDDANSSNKDEAGRKRRLPGFLKRETVEQLWAPVIRQEYRKTLSDLEMERFPVSCHVNRVPNHFLDKSLAYLVFSVFLNVSLLSPSQNERGQPQRCLLRNGLGGESFSGGPFSFDDEFREGKFRWKKGGEVALSIEKTV